MNMSYCVNETVEYKSQYEGEWKIGAISRFTEEGLTICASIWEHPAEYKHPYVTTFHKHLII